MLKIIKFRDFQKHFKLIVNINTRFSLWNNIVFWWRKNNTLGHDAENMKDQNFKKIFKNNKTNIKNEKKNIFFKKYSSRIFLSAESSMTSPGGNQVDALPPASSSFRDEGFPAFILGRWRGGDVFAVTFLAACGHVGFRGRGSLVCISCIFQLTSVHLHAL